MQSKRSLPFKFGSVREVERSDVVRDKPVDREDVCEEGSNFSEELCDKVLVSRSSDSSEDSLNEVSGSSGVFEDRLVRELSVDLGVLDREFVVLVDLDLEEGRGSLLAVSSPSLKAPATWSSGDDMGELARVVVVFVDLVGE